MGGFRAGLLVLALFALAVVPGTAAQSDPPGVAPVGIRIEKARVNAEVAPAQIVNGVPDEPQCPWVVYWYEETGRLGVSGNAIMVGAYDWWEVGPSVFFNLERLKKDDEIELIGEDGKVYRFEVDAVTSCARANAPIGAIFSPRSGEKWLTLLTSAGEFDANIGQYKEILVVTARRTSERAQPLSATSSSATPVPGTDDPDCLQPDAAS